MKKILSLFLVSMVCISVMAQTKVFKMANYVGSIGTTYVNTQTTYGSGENAITLIPGTDANTGWKKFNDSTLIIGKNGAAIQLPAFTFAVSKIIVKGAPSGASGKVTYNIFVDTVAVSTQQTGANGSHTFLIDAAHQAAGTIYKIKNTNSNNNQITSIEIYEALAGAPEVPVFSVAEGTYTTAQAVALTCATEGASIYYTLDGSDPSAASTLYNGAIQITKTTTIKAVAIKNGVASTIVSATYAIVTVTGQGTENNPYTVTDVKTLNNPGTQDVWVAGTIVGVYASNKPTSTIGTVATNIALANGTDTIPVELPAGGIRNALNLVDNPSLMGIKAKVKGNLVSYFSLAGVKGTNEYRLGDLSVATFEEDTLATESVKQYALSEGPATFVSGGFSFMNYNSYGYYYAFTLTNKTTTAGTDYNDAYESACGGAKNGSNYAVWYSNSYNGGDSIVFAQASKISGFYVCNTTYTEHVILNGNAYGRKLDQEGDSLTLHIMGYDVNGNSTGTLAYNLAYTTNDTLYYAKDWTWVNLSPLSAETKYIKFNMTGSDTGAYGLNTPTYFAMDDLGGAASKKPATFAIHPWAAVSALDDVKVNNTQNSKFLRNGQLIILHNGVYYTPAGQILK